ncbi:MAG: DUF3108 domain-containing protein [bacterium]
MAKKNRTLYLIFAFLFVSYSSSTDCFENSLWRKVENRAFEVREKLIYIVKWKGIAGGTSVMEVKKIVKISDRDAYYVTLSTRSSGFFDIFFKIRDLIESYVDKEGIFTWKQRKRLRGGKYRSNKETIYDQEKHQALYKGKKIDIPFYVQDSLSSVYYLRTQELKKGTSVIMDANDDGKNYLVEVKVIGIEKVATPSGKFKALKTEVVWKREGKVGTESSKIWLSNDERKVPVKIEKQGKIGTITMLLKRAKF